jgi:hypothetical protein
MPYPWNLLSGPILFAQTYSNLASFICNLHSNYCISPILGFALPFLPSPQLLWNPPLVPLFLYEFKQTDFYWFTCLCSELVIFKFNVQNKISRSSFLHSKEWPASVHVVPNCFSQMMGTKTVWGHYQASSD